MLGSGFMPDRIGFANVGFPSAPGRIGLTNVGCGPAAAAGAGGWGLLASDAAAQPPPSAAAAAAVAIVERFAPGLIVHSRRAIQAQDGAAGDRIVRGAERSRSAFEAFDHYLTHRLGGLCLQAALDRHREWGRLAHRRWRAHYF